MKIRYILFFVAVSIFSASLFMVFKKQKTVNASSKFISNTVMTRPLTNIKFSKVLINNGKGLINVPMVANFVVYNKGLQDLYIQLVEPDCHCTVANFSKIRFYQVILL